MELPETYTSFLDAHPEIGNAYHELGTAVHQAGPLDEKTRALVKLGTAIGLGSEGAVHSHTRKCVEADASADEIRHVVLLSLPTIGFPSMMACMTWVEDILLPEKK